MELISSFFGSSLKLPTGSSVEEQKSSNSKKDSSITITSGDTKATLSLSKWGFLSRLFRGAVAITHEKKTYYVKKSSLHHWTQQNPQMIDATTKDVSEIFVKTFNDKKAAPETPLEGTQPPLNVTRIVDSAVLFKYPPQ